MVRAELAKDGQVGNDVLLKKARTIDPKLRRLTSRQFHGTYRLPALREAKRAQRVAGGVATPAPSKAASGSKPSNGSRSGRRRNVRQAPAAAPAAAPASEIMDAAMRDTSVSSKIARDGSTPAPSTSTAVARPRAAEREVVRQVLQSVAREALAVEDRAAFIRLLDSLDQRAEMILSVAGRG
jgi:hypothetical protein